VEQCRDVCVTSNTCRGYSYQTSDYYSWLDNCFLYYTYLDGGVESTNSLYTCFIKKFQTCAPTLDPSFAPTASQPTFAPISSQPTFAPISSEPTLQPSDAPISSQPTLQPSDAPVTQGPTQEPTSSEPTFEPSFAPVTSSPTFTPSEAPVTSTPTMGPVTSGPTLEPSHAPTETTDYEWIMFLNQFDEVITSEDELPAFLVECSAYLAESFNTAVYCDLMQSFASGKATLRIAGPQSQIPEVSELVNMLGLQLDNYPSLYTETTGTPEPTTAEPTPLTCADDEVEVEVFVTISVWNALDLKWSISDTCQNTVGYLSGPMEGQPDMYDTTHCCLPPTTYTLVCETWTSSGWEDSKLAVNGVVYCDSIEEDEAHLLNLCPNEDCTGISTTPIVTTPTIVINTGTSGGVTITSGTSGTSITDGGDSCFFAQDGECDEHWGGCDAGTDCTDCGNCEDSDPNQDVLVASGAFTLTVGFTLALLLLF